MCFQVAVSPKYFDSTGEQAGESVAADINDENDATSPSQKGVVYLMRKVVASFYHYKMELLAVFILLDQLPALAVISGIYFFVRFFIQLYLDQRAITS